MVLNSIRIIAISMLRKFFSQRSISDWNSLPRDISELPNVNTIIINYIDVYWQDLRFRFLIAS